MRQPADPGRSGPQAVDWIEFGILVVGFGLEAVLRTDLTWPFASFVTAVVMALAMVWRRVHPASMAWIAYGSAAALTIISAVVNGQAPFVGLYGSAVPALVLPYALFRWGSGRQILVGKFALVMIWGVSSVLETNTRSDVIGGLIVLILPCLLGWGVRAQVDSQQRRLGEAAAVERERLARELHDTVAHHVSAIAIQAQAGQAQAESCPDAAVEALGTIEREASRTLAEMRTIVKMLRRGTEQRDRYVDVAATVTPATTADLERLVAADAIEMTIRRRGPVDELPAAVDHAIYRIVQESVTNVNRHAATATRVDVSIEVVGDVALVDVTDDGGAATTLSADGFGVMGMRERARLLGGSLTAGPASVGWLVHAELPLIGPGRALPQ